MALFTLFTGLTGCVQSRFSYGTPNGLRTQSQTIDLEAADRIARFQRLAFLQGSVPPHVDQVYAPAGSVPGVAGPVPVVRVVFEERAFFDFDQAVPRPESASINRLIAANMQRDVPDAAVTVLGHTDAIGSDAYNVDLSRRRAATVMSELIVLGVNPDQLSTVGVGKAQPIAANSTAIGRTRNRRVEFLISGSEQANLAVIRERPIEGAYLPLVAGEPFHAGPATTVQVFKPMRRPTGPDDDGILGPMGILTLSSPEPGASPATAAPAVAAKLPALVQQPAPPSDTPSARAPEPAAVVVPRTPESVEPALPGEPTPQPI